MRFFSSLCTQKIFEQGDVTMLKVKLIGIGAAGNKAAITAFEKGVVAEDELLLINSNLGDIP